MHNKVHLHLALRHLWKKKNRKNTENFIETQILYSDFFLIVQQAFGIGDCVMLCKHIL